LRAIDKFLNSDQIFVLVFLFTAVFLGIGVVLQPLVAFALLGLLSVCFILLYDDRIFVLIIIVWNVIQYLPTRVYPVLPDQAVWIDDGAVFILVIYWFVRRLFSGQFQGHLKFDLIFLFFVAIGVISTLINQVSLQIAVEGIRAIVQPFLLYYILQFGNYSKKTLYFFVVLIFVMFSIQLPFVIFNGVQTGQWWGDYIWGTFGQDQMTGFGHFMSIGLITICGLLLVGFRKLWVWIAFFLILIPLIMASSRLSYFLIPVILLWLVFKQRILTARTLLLIITASTILIVGVFFSYSLTTRDLSFFENLNPVQILSDQLNPSNSGRLLWYQFAWDTLKQKPYTFLIGYGPGMFSSFTAQRNNTPIFVIIDYIRQSQGFALYPGSEYISIPGEFGFFGLAAILWLFVYVFRKLNDVINNVDEKFWKGTALGTSGALIYFVIAGLTQNTWETPFVANFIWLMIGIVLTVKFSDRKAAQRDIL
jgi:O-antigen ligase